MKDLIAVVGKDPFCLGYSVLLRGTTDEGRRQIGDYVALVDHNPGEVIRPTFGLSEDAAQALMDNLYSLGLRPSEDAARPKTMEAVSAHLLDVQRQRDAMQAELARVLRHLMLQDARRK